MAKTNVSEKGKILFVSLGCDKNLVDTEEMLGLLRDDGYGFTDDETEADIIIINSCCFINDAKEESINTILEMAELKKEGKLKALVVTGCLAERYKKEILDEIEEVDAVLGTASYDNIVSILEKALGGEKQMNFMPLDRLVLTETNRILTGGGHFAHLKIAEGCDKHCTYCIIPKIRGRYRSVQMEKLIREAEYLASQGVKELIIVAQETTIYGVDIYGEKSLHKLLNELCKIKGISFIRLMYCYPEEIYDELIETMKNQEKICNYIDMPIQHCSNNILKRMGRRTSKEDIISIINKLRREIPDIVIRTTLISGFPGETKDDHEELLDFVDEMEFERLGVFAYSPEEDTPAAIMEDQIDDAIKEERRAELMELQQEIAFDNGEKYIGKEVLAVIEGKIADENAYVARTYMDAPDIDGNIFITSGELLMTGDFVKVKVTGSCDYDLIGEII